jgi:hypothetical protein
MAVAARGRDLYRSASDDDANDTNVVKSLSEKITAFVTTIKQEFCSRLEATDYLQAHTWMQAECKEYFNRIVFLEKARDGHLSQSEMELIQPLKQTMYSVSRACGPPPLPVDTESRFKQRNVPADNSCLFHCIKRIYRCQENTMKLRQQCVDHVLRHKEELSVIAGEDFVSDYEEEMLNEDTWGSAFEINVQCILRRVRITLFDLISKSEQTFGNTVDGPEPLTAAFLLRVDGNHYDYLSWVGNEEDERTVFSIYDETARRRARRFAVSQCPGDWRVDGEKRAPPVLRQSSWA